MIIGGGNLPVTPQVLFWIIGFFNIDNQNCLNIKK